MRRSILLLAVLMVLVVTRPNLVNCRVFQSQEKVTHGELVKELKFPRRTSVMKEKAHIVDNISNRVLIGNQVHTMSSGPSRRGSGH